MWCGVMWCDVIPILVDNNEEGIELVAKEQISDVIEREIDDEARMIVGAYAPTRRRRHSNINSLAYSRECIYDIVCT
jgi:hypothetical protein